MKQDNQLSLCDPHNSIIHEFGCESSCTKAAAICRKGCSQYQHKQKVSKHQFIHARQFYTMVSHLRQDYKGFSHNFKEVHLKRYINEVQQALKTFQENMLEKINTENSLIDIYSRNSGEIFETILEEKQQDIEFAQLKCKEVFQIKYFYNALTKTNQEQQEKRVMKILMKMFEDHLKNLRLIPLPVKPQKQQKNKFTHKIQSENMEQATIKIKQAVKMRQNNQLPQQFDEMFIKIKENMHQQRDTFELRQKLDAFFQAKHHLLQITKVPELTLAVKGILSASKFWLDLIKFAGREKIKNLKILTSEQTQESKSLKNQILTMNKDKFAIRFVTGDWQNNLEYLIFLLNR